MIYFILWAVLIVGVIIAFFVAMAMDKPKKPKAIAAPVENMDEAAFEDVPAEEEAPAEAAFEEVPMQAEEAVVDDFAAFDNEFK